MFVTKVYSWLQSRFEIEIHCLLCRARTLWRQPICQYCLDSCPVPVSFCSLCSIPLEQSDTGLCGKCLSTPPLFDLCLSAYLYEFPVNRIIQCIKYSSRLELIKPFTQQLTETLKHHYLDNPWPEAIIPVPMHNKRLRQRGYDQTLLLSRQIQQQLTDTTLIPVDSNILKRHKATRPQQGLSAKARRKNLKNAFSLSEEIPYQHIALIDDVVTTGETVSEICRQLKKRQDIQIDIWCLARTPIDKNHF